LSHSKKGFSDSTNVPLDNQKEHPEEKSVTYVSYNSALSLPEAELKEYIPHPKLTEVVNRKQISEKIIKINLRNYLKYTKGLSKKAIRKQNTEIKTDAKIENQTKTDHDN